MRKISSRYRIVAKERVTADLCRRIEDQQRAKEAAHQKQLDAVRQEAAKAGEAIHAEYQSKETELQRQLDYVRKTAETEKDRAQRRFEGERADLKATIARLEAAEAEASRVQRRTEAEKADIQASLSRLEVDLMKVRHVTGGIRWHAVDIL